MTYRTVILSASAADGTDSRIYALDCGHRITRRCRYKDRIAKRVFCDQCDTEWRERARA